MGIKNLWLLPTDKPSRLYLGNNRNFVFGMMQTSIQSRNDDFTNQNIYITSDEEIKEGDWVYSERFKNILQFKLPSNSYFYKKIILTTDQDLIKDGVQAIDDEFLNWFVKNPSCEEVEIDTIETLTGSFDAKGIKSNYVNVYKIIIPKEKTKQETLEEVAERLYSDKEYPMYGEIRRDGFINGAKWKQEQDKKLYSEEEVLPLLEMLQKCKEYFLLKTDLKSEERADAIVQVLETFKNK